MAEKPTMRLIISIIAGITNMVLDLLLIAVFDMGVVGAALATCISQVVGGIVPLIYFIIRRIVKLSATLSLFFVKCF